MDNIDRRKSPRMPLNLPFKIELQSPPQNIPKVVSGKSFDISQQGIGVNLKNVILPPGISGILNVDSPDFTFKAECKVVWSNSPKNGESQCGIYFIKMENGHLSILNKITAKKYEQKRKFAFITNLRDAGDWQRVVFTSKFLPKNADLTSLRQNPGFIVWTHFDVYNKVEGYIIVVLTTGKEILSMPPKEARSKILDAALFAQNNLGAEYIGLGSYVPSITRQGLWLESQPGMKGFLTHGDHLTSWIALEGIREKSGISVEESTIAIVGAAGLLGHPISRMLAKDTKKLILIGRNPNKLNKLKELIMSENAYPVKEPFATTDITAIKEADLVISATSSPDAIIKEDYLKEGVIIYDLAQPMDVTPEVCLKRPDIVKIDGGFVTIPGIELGINLGTPNGSAFSCLGDAMLQCLENTKRNFIGPVDPVWLEKIGEYAKKYNFKHVSPCCFSWPIPEMCIPHKTRIDKRELMEIAK